MPCCPGEALDGEAENEKRFGGKLNAALFRVQVLDEKLVSKALDVAEQELGSTVNVVVNCAGIAIAQRVLSKKGPHPLDSFIKVRVPVHVCGIRCVKGRFHSACPRPSLLVDVELETCRGPPSP